jgi:hypothetical protein
VPNADSVIEAGDQVLLILDPGLENDITPSSRQMARGHRRVVGFAGVRRDLG